MIDFITTTMNELGDYPIAWDIVNEAIDNKDNGFIKDSPWKIIGDDYICKAYKAARAANPKAKLFYNDYKHASMTGYYEDKSNKVFYLMKDLRDNNCGVDGVGFQSHVDLSYEDENYESIAKNIQRFTKLFISSF